MNTMALWKGYCNALIMDLSLLVQSAFSKLTQMEVCFGNTAYLILPLRAEGISQALFYLQGK